LPAYNIATQITLLWSPTPEMKYSLHNTHTVSSLDILVLLFYAKKKNNLVMNPVRKGNTCQYPNNAQKETLNYCDYVNKCKGNKPCKWQVLTKKSTTWVVVNQHQF
jgi:hypothetical protein